MTKRYHELKALIKTEFARYDKLIFDANQQREELEAMINSNNILIGYCEEIIGMIQGKPQYIEITKIHLAQLDHLRSSNKKAFQVMCNLEPVGAN